MVLRQRRGAKWDHTAANLDGVGTLPNHGNDRAAVHVCPKVSIKKRGRSYSENIHSMSLG